MVSITAVMLFGTPRSRTLLLGLDECVLRRLDHSNIALVIAGTTALAVALLSPDAPAQGAARTQSGPWARRW